jgi:hypothetical protein
MLKLPQLERPRRIARLSEQPAAWAHYLVGRRRKRCVMSPASIAGLKLWLDAGVGVLRGWDAAPVSGSGVVVYSPPSEYTANNHTHGLRVYPFKTVEGLQVFSSNYLELQVTDDGSTNDYHVQWSWEAVTGAEGYRLLKFDSGNGFTFDYFVDVTSEDLLDSSAAQFAPGATVTPGSLSDAGADDPVAMWRDQSGNENDATQVTFAKRPTWKHGILAGRPVLRFDNVDDGMITPLWLGVPLTVFVVYAYRSTVLDARRAVQGSANWLIGPYALVHEFYAGENFVGGPATQNGVFVVQAGWQNGLVTRNYINGALVGQANDGGNVAGIIGLGTEGNYAEPLNGDIAEVLAFDTALSAEDIDRVWDFFAAKYQLA